MIEILASPPHVAAYRFTDELTGVGYDARIADLEDRLARFARIAVVSDISDLHAVAGEVIGKDLRYALSRRGEYDRFVRAVVTRSGVRGTARHRARPTSFPVRGTRGGGGGAGSQSSGACCYPTVCGANAP